LQGIGCLDPNFYVSSFKTEEAIWGQRVKGKGQKYQNRSF